MDSWRGRVRDEVRETHEADRAALVCAPGGTAAVAATVFVVELQ
jgi:hypothetical protein